MANISTNRLTESFYVLLHIRMLRNPEFYISNFLLKSLFFPCILCRLNLIFVVLDGFLEHFCIFMTCELGSSFCGIHF